MNTKENKTESRITVNVRWFDGKLKEFGAVSAPEFGTDMLHIRYNDDTVSLLRIPLREVRWFSMSKESHAQEKETKFPNILYNHIMVNWLDDYEEVFECSEIRIGSDLLWMRLTSGENRHIPLRNVRLIDSIICRPMEFNI